MIKIGIPGQPLSEVIAALGYTDSLVIADAGLPIPVQTTLVEVLSF